jgi:hypothetical protein
MRARLRQMLGWAPTVTVLAVMLGVVCLAWTGHLPGEGDAADASQEKEVLLSYLPDVNHVSYAKNVLYLYADETPLMVIWVEDDPAELYGGDGRFVSPLSFQDLSRVIRRASALLQGDARWSNARKRPDGPDHTA